MIRGKTMIERVYRGAAEASRLDDLRVATDDPRIADACRAFGAPVEMTRSDHETGSDRLAEVAGRVPAEIVVNIQGDEPLIRGFVIDAAVEALQKSGAAVMSTVAHRLPTGAEEDSNRVKVVCDLSGGALYFSRAPIPFPREASTASVLQHVGLYAFRREFLLDYAKLAPTPLETRESLEQLRVLEHGYKIQVAEIADWESCPVDVPADIRRVEAQLRDESD
jgi:3-deoxy-manno-octulosonate cytidylyltransferase (CMP-KDO synthetase)